MKILHIYGPLAIHAYGVTIALGLSTFLWFIRKDNRLNNIVNPEVFNNIVALGIFVGIIGGRFLYSISEWEHLSLLEAFMPWTGGFSILGTVIAITGIIPLYLYYLQIPILPLLDLAGLYAPLMQSISRIGCLLSGCCYGQPSHVMWAITYNQNSIAPCFIPLHPTQLYSSIALLILFLILYFIVQYRYSKPGQLTCFYFIGIGIERFVIDFWRADRIFSSHPLFQILSMHQWIACGIIIIACGSFIFVTRKSST